MTLARGLALSLSFSLLQLMAQPPANPGIPANPGLQNVTPFGQPNPQAAAQPAAAAQSQATTAAQSQAPAVEGGSMVLNLPNANLVDVIDILARRLKLNYILDPRVKGSVMLNTYGEIRATDIRSLLDTILRINNAMMVQVGDIWRIVPAGDVARLPLRPQQLEREKLAEDESPILNLIFLKYAAVGEMVKLISPFLGESASVSSYEPANLLLILDSSRSMRRTMELIGLFDSDSMAQQRVRLFELRFAQPSEVADELQRIMKGIAMGSSSNAIRYLPVDRINTLICVAPNPGVFEEVERWLAKLDTPAKPPVGATDNFVYRLKYARATNIALALTMLYMNQNNGPMGNLSTIMLMTMLEQSNSGSNSGGGFGGGFGGGGFGGGMGMGGMGMGGFGGFGGMGGMGGFGGMGMGGFGGMGMMGMNPMMMGMNPMMMGGMGMAQGMGAQGASPFTPARPNADGSGTTMAAAQGNVNAPLARVPSIVPNPQDNSLLIQSTPQEFEQIKRLLNALDIPPRQVLIEAKIYEVLLTDAFASGVQAFLQRQGTTRNNSTNVRQLLGASTGTGVQLSAGWLVSQSRELMGFLTAQEDNRRSKVISAPSVIATDNIAATINVGQEVPTLQSQGVAGGVQQGGNSVFANTVASRSAGTRLGITARILPSGVVTLIIDQEVSAPQAPAANAAIQSPSFSTRNVQTQVTVQDGDTIAIGGIIQESNTFSTSGIPLLHRLPVVGGAFGSRSVSKERTELVIFMTPRVIYDTTEITEASDELRSRFRRLNKLIKE
jgi:general secretion pathway protein D